MAQRWKSGQAAPRAGAPALFDKQYSYGAAGSNNGNIYTITNVEDSTRTQTFSYDVLNRLISAQDQTHWANTYTYDAWGNMQKVPVVNVPGENLQVAGDAYNHMLNYTYDAAGNMQSDGTYRYTFDAENRIACMNPDVNWVCNVNSISYTYDADGRRVQKSSGTNYWYGPSGAALAETDSSGNWTNYIFFGGQRLARNVSGDIKYYITDHLHSTAMFVDKAGTILDDNDMYPWGGIVPGVGKTTSNNTVKFTGQYRDGESQLDYFGARYYSNNIGRFMSPDWDAKPITVPYAKFGDPQSLNLYSYTENGPVNRIDADGHFMLRCQVCSDPSDSGFSVAPSVDRAPGVAPDDGAGAQHGGSGTAGSGPFQVWNGHVSILGQNVNTTFTIKQADVEFVTDRIVSIASDIDRNASKLDLDEKQTIMQIKEIKIIDNKTEYLGIIPGSHVMKLSVTYLRESSVAWDASVVAHEGQHDLNNGRYVGTNAWRDEQTAAVRQLFTGIKLGLNEAEKIHLRNIIRDKPKLQQHVKEGFKY